MANLERPDDGVLFAEDDAIVCLLVFTCWAFPSRRADAVFDAAEVE